MYGLFLMPMEPDAFNRLWLLIPNPYYTAPAFCPLLYRAITVFRHGLKQAAICSCNYPLHMAWPSGQPPSSSLKPSTALVSEFSGFTGYQPGNLKHLAFRQNKRDFNRQKNILKNIPITFN